MQLLLRDQFGNPAQPAGDAPLAVEATSAAAIAFEPATGGIFWCAWFRGLLVPTVVGNASSGAPSAVRNLIFPTALHIASMQSRA